MCRPLQTVQLALKSRRLRDQNLVVATSGGPDSQALLHILACLQKRIGLKALWACGIDHGLRAEARDELALAESLAVSLGVSFALRRVQVARQGNLLANARRARYRALRTFAASVGARFLVLAHTATDQVETILMNLARGAGLRGAGGMPSRRGPLLRPMLRVTRREVLEYLDSNGIAYANDPSNSNLARVRARLRDSVLPTLASVNPQFERSFVDFAGLARDDDRALEAQAKQHLREAMGPLDALSCQAVVGLPRSLGRRVVRQWLTLHGIPVNRGRIGGLLKACAGPEPSSSIAPEAQLDRGYLWATKTAKTPEQILTIPGQLHYASINVRIGSAVHDEWASRLPEWNEKREVAFDAGRLHFDFTVRPWQEGDRLEPFGLDGHIKVGDLFTNAKLPRALRRHWPVVVHGDELVWVVGLRRGSFAPINGRTQRVVSIWLEGELPWLRW